MEQLQQKLMKQLSFKSNVQNAFIHPEKYFNFTLDQFISLLKQGQRCTNVEKWKIKSILSPKIHLARFYGIFKEVAYFCMRPIDNYLSALDGFLSSKLGFWQNPSNVWLLPTFYVWGEKDEVEWSFSEKTMQWQGLVSNQVSQKLCFKSQSPHNIICLHDINYNNYCTFCKYCKIKTKHKSVR